MADDGDDDFQMNFFSSAPAVQPSSKVSPKMSPNKAPKAASPKLAAKKTVSKKNSDDQELSVPSVSKRGKRTDSEVAKGERNPTMRPKQKLSLATRMKMINGEIPATQPAGPRITHSPHLILFLMYSPSCSETAEAPIQGHYCQSEPEGKSQGFTKSLSKSSTKNGAYCSLKQSGFGFFTESIAKVFSKDGSRGHETSRQSEGPLLE